MKISIIGAGNVGATCAMRIAQEGLGQVLLVDIAASLAKGKAADLQDARFLLKCDYHISGTSDIAEIKDSNLVIVTAGLVRKPGMAREELLSKNAGILGEIAENIARLAPEATVIVVTNPLDLMTRLVLQKTGFKRAKVFGMGISLDASRFANLIAEELDIPTAEILPCLIGSHGEGMLPLPRLTSVKGVVLDEFLNEERCARVVSRTKERGAEIVGCLGNASAYFAPSAAVLELVRAVVKDEKRTIGVSALLDGEYGIKGACIGVPCRLGKKGIEKIVELELDSEEKKALLQAAERLKEQYSLIERA
ncbi:MAG: malate dehydrogenase [Candidatus Omnitrophica bacterium]|nr:malate dehydrogenase [Candidatus Omnitrophota bacterium]